jgi:hypothetical protein
MFTNRSKKPDRPLQKNPDIKEGYTDEPERFIVIDESLSSSIGKMPTKGELFECLLSGALSISVMAASISSETEKCTLDSLCNECALGEVEIRAFAHMVQFPVQSRLIFRPEEDGFFSEGVCDARLLEFLEVDHRRECKRADAFCLDFEIHLAVELDDEFVSCLCANRCYSCR